MLPIVIDTTSIPLRTIYFVALITGIKISDSHHEFDIFASPISSVGNLSVGTTFDLHG